MVECKIFVKENEDGHLVLGSDLFKMFQTDGGDEIEASKEYFFFEKFNFFCSGGL